MKTNKAAVLFAAAAALLLGGVAVLPATHAQGTKPLEKPKVAAKPNIAPGQRLAPGQTPQIGTLYAVGTGDNQINVRVDKIERVKEYTFLYSGQKRRQRVERPENEAYLLVHLTVQNPQPKPRIVFDGAVAPTAKLPPLLHIAAVREYKNDNEARVYADVYNAVDFYRTSDGARLVWDGPKSELDRIAPGQTMQVFSAHKVILDRTATTVQLNYYTHPLGGGIILGPEVDEDARPTLMVFGLAGKVASGSPAAPTEAARSVATSGIPWGDPATAGTHAQVGKTYRVGAGEAVLELTVDKIEAVDKKNGASDFGGQHSQARMLLAYLTVRNPTKKPLLAFSTSLERAWLQPALWRVQRQERPLEDRYSGYRADYFYRASDAKELTYLKDADMSAKNPAVVQPGQTSKAMIAVEYTDSPTLGALVFLRINYSVAPYAALNLTEDSRRSEQVDAQEIVATLLSFPLGDDARFTPLYVAGQKR